MEAKRAFTEWGKVLLGLLERQNLSQKEVSNLAQIQPAQLSRWMHQRPPKGTRGKEAIIRIGSVLEPKEPGACHALLASAGFLPYTLDWGRELSPREAAEKALLEAGASHIALGRVERGKTPGDILEELYQMPTQIFGGSPREALRRLDEIEHDLRKIKSRSRDAAIASALVWRERSRAQVETSEPSNLEGARKSAEAARHLAESLSNITASQYRWLDADSTFSILVCERVMADAGVTEAIRHEEVAELLRDRALRNISQGFDDRTTEPNWVLLELSKALIGAAEKDRRFEVEFQRVSSEALEMAVRGIEAFAQDRVRAESTQVVLAMAHETRARGLIRLARGRVDPDASLHLLLGRQAAERSGLKTVEFQIRITEFEMHLRQIEDREKRFALRKYLDDLLDLAPSLYQKTKALRVASRYNLDSVD